MICVCFDHKKNNDIATDNVYGIGYNLIKNKPNNCRVKIYFSKPKQFKMEFKELLWEYLEKGQRKEITRLIEKREAKKEARRNKRKNRNEK